MKYKYVYYKEDNIFIGYLDEFPDYRTQGQAIEELEENLKDIFHELNSGNIPHVRHVAELEIG